MIQKFKINKNCQDHELSKIDITNKFVSPESSSQDWRVQEKGVWFSYDWEKVPLEVKTQSVVGSNVEIHFRVAKIRGSAFARVVVRMSETPIYFVHYCQGNTPLTNFPAAEDNDRIWKFYKHGFEGISIECNGVQVADLKFAEAPKAECLSSEWVTSGVVFLLFGPNADETLVIKGNLVNNIIKIENINLKRYKQ